MKKIFSLLAILICAILCAAPAYAESAPLKTYSFDKKKASKEWSARKTFVVGKTAGSAFSMTATNGTPPKRYLPLQVCLKMLTLSWHST